VLELGRDLLDEVLAHARGQYPNEGCGVLVGPEGFGRAERFVALRNAAPSPSSSYELDPMDQLELYRGLESRGEEVVVIYHSHPHTEAYPSATDVFLAADPDPHYLLVSTRDGREEVRSFVIRGGVVGEEQLRVLEP